VELLASFTVQTHKAACVFWRSGHFAAEFQCLLSRVKRTLVGDAAICGHQGLKIAPVQLTAEAHFVDRQSLLEKKHTAACGGCAAAVDEIRFRP